MKILKKNDLGMLLTSLEKKLMSWIRKNIGLPEILIASRHVIISIQSWYLTPLLLRNFNNFGATFVMFVLAFLISCLFIKISDKYKGDWFKMEALKRGEHIKSKTFLVKILIFLSKKPKETFWFLYFLDPQLFALWSRPGHHQYDGLRDKKTLFLFITSSLFAAVLWTVLIMIFSYLGVLPYLTAILIGSLILISFLIIGSISIATLLKGLIVVINNLEVFAYIATVIMILTLLLSMTL